MRTALTSPSHDFESASEIPRLFVLDNIDPDLVGEFRARIDPAETLFNTISKSGGTAETIHTDMIRAAFSTDARLAIAPLQDYLGLGSEARFNIPGTSSNNWRWRLENGELNPEIRGQVAAMVEESGRALQN